MPRQWTAKGSRYTCDTPTCLPLLLRRKQLGLQDIPDPSYSAVLPALFPLRYYYSPPCSLPPSRLPAPTPQQAQEMVLPTPRGLPTLGLLSHPKFQNVVNLPISPHLIRSVIRFIPLGPTDWIPHLLQTLQWLPSALGIKSTSLTKAQSPLVALPV